jgi:predicted phage terminase large subunit-like protein
MREADPHGFWTLYMGQPRDPKGSVFQPHMIELLPVAPVLPGARFVRAWDLAATSAADGGRDYTVGMLVALHAKRIYILDVVRGRWDAGKVEQVILHTAQRDGIGVRIVLPQDPGQSGKVQVRALTALLRGYIVESAPVSGSKLQRAQVAASQSNVGNMACVQASWTNALLDELRDFTDGARQDDQVDALASGVAALGDLNITPEELRKRLEEQRAKLATQAMQFMAPSQKDTPAHKQWLAELAAVDEQLNPEAAQRIHDANEQANAEREALAAAQARADEEWNKGAPERATLEAAHRAAYDAQCARTVTQYAQRLTDARAHCAGAISQASAEGFTVECHDGRVRLRAGTERARIQGPSPRLVAMMRTADVPLRTVYIVGDSAPLPAYEPLRFDRPPVKMPKPKVRVQMPTAERVAKAHYFEGEEEV